MKRNTRKIGRKGSRLEPDWLGVFTIVSMTGQQAVIKNNATGRELKPIHLTHLKPYIQPEIPLTSTSNVQVKRKISEVVTDGSNNPAKRTKIGDAKPVYLNDMLIHPSDMSSLADKLECLTDTVST